MSAAVSAWAGLAAGRSVDLDAKLDLVRGRNQDSGDALPRLAPRRTTLGVNLVQDGWTARLEVKHSSAQTRVPSTDLATPGWKVVNLSASWALRLGEHDAMLFVKLQNAGNSLAYSASTISTVRPLAPLPGRGLTVGVRLAF